MNKLFGTYKGKPVDENITKEELLEIIGHLAFQYSGGYKYNLKIEKSITQKGGELKWKH